MLVARTDYVGGLLGISYDGTVTNSYAAGPVSGGSGSEYIGGLVGIEYGGTISNSYAAGSVSGSAYVGGLVGYNYESASVSNSYATGGVSGSGYVGGLVGYNDSTGTITNTYAAGSVSGAQSIGGLAGYNGGTVSNSFWDTTTSGQATSAGGTGLTTSQMQTASNFTAFNFTTTQDASGNNWVIVDTDGTLNNAVGRAGATFPMLASEYSTTINNAHQLQLMAMNLAASYSLGQNINASATGTGTDVWGSSGFVPIGDSQSTIFTGSFNGLGHTISNLTTNLPSANLVGLFGFTGPGSTVENVGLLGGSVSGYDVVGGLVALNDGGKVTNSYTTGSVSGNEEVGGLVGYSAPESTVSNSYATGNVSGSSVAVGGLVGYSNGGVVTNSYATGSVIGFSAVGGLVGQNVGTVSNSYATGNVSGSTVAIGGLVGLNDSSVANSYAIGNVSGSSGSEYVGGLVGYNNGGMVTNSYATGSVSGAGGSDYIGGLVGYNAGTVNTSFWDSDINATGVGGGTISGATGLTTAQMQTASSFTGWSIATTGGSGDIWRIYEGNTFPLLISFLTPLTLTDAPDTAVTYNGTVQSGPSTAISGVLGAAATGTNAGFYNGYYSTQQGYDITGGNLTITPASLTLSGTRVYDGTTIVAGSVLTATGVGGQTFSVTGAGDPSNLASKNVQTDSTLATVTGLTLGSSGNGGLSSNYEPLSTTGSSISITPLALTGASIAPASSTYGSTVTPGAVSFSNVIPGDVVSSTASIASPLYSTSGNLKAGSYAQTATGLSGADATDYTFAGYTTPTNGYTVNQLALTGAAIAAGNSTYGSSVMPGTVSFGNVISGDLVGSTASIVSPFYSTSGNLRAGSYVQTASGLTGADAANYSFGGYTTPTNNYTVNQLALTGAAIAAGNSTYGSSVMPGTVSFSNVISGDLVGSTASILSPVYSTSGNLRAGSYAQTASVQLGGADAGNYSFGGYTTPTNNYTVSQLELMGAAIAAGSSTYGSSVTPGTVSFSNVIGGDLVGSTASLASPLYSTSGNLRAGSYAQTASGLTGTDAGNYSFGGYTTPTNNYAVNQLALTGATIAAGNSTYGSAVIPGVVSFNNVISGDLVGSTASIANPAYSTSGHLDAGSYAQTASGLTGADAGNYTFGGYTTGTNNYTVGQLALMVTGLTGTNRAYNGSTADTLHGTASIAPIGGDVVHLSGTGSGSFANANVGTAKPVTVSGYSLTGTDSGNYLLVEPTTLTANITRLANVAWVGGASGNWSLASNWAGGAIPDYANVAAVTIPSGDTVTYDSGVPGATTLTTLTNSGNLVMAAGNLSTTGNLSTAGYEQSGGMLTVGGSLTINSVSGGVTLGAIKAGSLNINSQSGAITQLASTTLDVTGTSSLTAPNYSITLANAADVFGGVVTSNASNIDLLQSSGGLKLGNTTATGTFTADSVAGAITQSAGTAVDVTGATSLTANNGGAVSYGITLANTTNDFVGAVTSTGSSINLLDTSAGGLILGNTIASGTLTATSRGGAITQSGATAVDVTGGTTLTANNGGGLGYGITLANTANDFVGAVTSNGSNINLLDSSTGGLKLGNTTASGTLTATSRGGALTQAAGTAINATGATNLTANNGGAVNYAITMGNGTNDLAGTVTATGGAITLDDAAALTAALDSSGASTLTSAGALTVSGTVGTSLTTKTTGTNSATTFGATTVGTTLKVTSTGAVTETSSNILTVAGQGTTTVHNANVTVNGVKGAEIP